jgi:hypothetical protein
VQITALIYQRKRSDRAYGNRSMQVCADLDEGEDPSVVCAQLRAIVGAALDQDEREEEERDRVREEERRARYAAEREERVRQIQQQPPWEDEGDDDDPEDGAEDDLEEDLP